MTTSGKLEPGPRGREDRRALHATPGTGQPFERTVTTDANGNWSDSIVPSDDGSPNGRPNRGAGDWLIEPRFEGDADYAPSTGPSCRVMVNNN